MRHTLAWTAMALLSLAGCAGRVDKDVAAAPSPVPPTPIAVVHPMPKGTYAGMAVPALLADGRYATPNRDLSGDGALWHLRAALNVAALACRGPDESAIVAGYNGFLMQQRTALAAAQARLTAEYAAGGGDWQDRYDDQMTRLYNFFSQSFGREAFCNAAAATLADSGGIAAADLPGFAAGRLAVLEKPFTDVYAAYDRWRAERAAASRMAMASVPQRVLAVQAVPAATPLPRPRLALDPSVFADERVVTR